MNPFNRHIPLQPHFGQLRFVTVHLQSGFNNNGKDFRGTAVSTYFYNFALASTLLSCMLPSPVGSYDSTLDCIPILSVNQRVITELWTATQFGKGLIHFLFIARAGCPSFCPRRLCMATHDRAILSFVSSRNSNFVDETALAFLWLSFWVTTIM